MPFVAFKVDQQLIDDFDIAAKSNHQNRSVFLRTLMVEAIKKESRKNPKLFDDDRR